jgi:hypothetical protein
MCVGRPTGDVNRTKVATTSELGKPRASSKIAATRRTASEMQMKSAEAMSKAELEKHILRLYRRGTGILKVGKTLGIGTGTVQRVLMEQPRRRR